ncbi:fungal-specific transcription factor domain-containing protein [Dactylonectria estremocensis]|uniref:Fungal-specific transcription factor domain-containing protein n=1 Tax=Dactylonectria estremocensis TaxID=1079267 RepID=A0A9P9EFM6_9HYPO|nr:fungal-specific transcription factor domain-containing protein [Dactylonectria estremocensis]
MPSQRVSPKCPLACYYCRVKKAKCDGLKPCGNCVSHREVCTFPEVPPRVRKRKEREQELEDRLVRMEQLLREATGGRTENQSLNQSQSEDAYGKGRANVSRASQPESPRVHEPRHSAPMSRLPDPVENSRSPTVVATTAIVPAGTAVQGAHQTLSPPTPHLQSQSIAPRDSPVQDTALSDVTPERPFDHTFAEGYGASPVAIPCLPAVSSAPAACAAVPFEPPREYLWNMPQSPGGEVDALRPKLPAYDDIFGQTEESERYLSLSSVPAVEWVSRQVGTFELDSSTPLSTDVIVRTERLGQSLEQTRAPEPGLETALRWTGAYFNSCPHSIFAALDRASFESRLRAHFKPDHPTSFSKSWYALRNVVYAAGCRFSISEDSGPEGFAKARSESWGYYQNALSVHTDLLYLYTDLTSIQALLLMGFYAEALGIPRLEYILVSEAVRLAQSRELHLENSDRANTRPEEALSRQCLWWALYTYEKHLACRSSRPSAIDDDYVSCTIPSTPQDGRSEDLEFITKAAQHAQISSDITKQLNSAKAMRETPRETMRYMQNLDARLIEWQQSLDPLYRAKAPFMNVPPQGKQLFRLLFLHFSYHVSVIAIHGAFCYPWDRRDFQSAKSPEIRAQIRSSTESVAQASRQIILGLQRLETMSTLPLWLTFYYPLVGLVNLLVFVLKDPVSSTVAADVSLMDIVVGYFGYLEFVSSSMLVFPFPRDITSHMRRFVEKSNKARFQANASTQFAEATAVAGGDMPPDSTKLNWAPLLPFSAEVSDMDDPLLGWEDLYPFLPSVSESTYFFSNDNNSRGGEIGSMPQNRNM